MVGAADVRWQAGDRTSAVAIYRRIVERVGDASGYGKTAATRIAEFEAGGKPAKAEPTSPDEPAGNAP
jgi:hypothetical protein